MLIKIKTNCGLHIGELAAKICHDSESAFKSMGISTEERFMSSWISRIPGGIMFPCTVLCNIYVESKHENQGYGTAAMNKLDKFSKQNSAAMSIVRIGWTGDQIKNLYFYKKNGWKILTRDNEIELFIGYKKY